MLLLHQIIRGEPFSVSASHVHYCKFPLAWAGRRGNDRVAHHHLYVDSDQLCGLSGTNHAACLDGYLPGNRWHCGTFRTTARLFAARFRQACL